MEMPPMLSKLRLTPAWVAWLNKKFAAQEKAVVFFAACILVFISIIDYLTGYELGFFIFYFIPVSITAWFSSKRKGIVMAFASAGCWYCSDLFSHHPYSKAYLIYWETFIRFLSFITTALLLSRIKEIESHQEQIDKEIVETKAENLELRRQLSVNKDDCLRKEG